MTAAAPSLLEPGGFFGTYRIVKPLGQGGTGQIYLVDGPEAGTRYALKILNPKIAARKPEFVRRFIREAEFAMNVRHPNLVEVYDAGQDDETGLCYLAMEHMAGGTLRDLIRTDRALSVAGAHAIALDIARALRFVEENGLVHRDVKPDNILFTKSGQAKLTDLGITRFPDENESDPNLTMAGCIVGTPGYIAPEQLMDPHAVDIRADIYSLGVIFYEMLVGERPNASDNAICTLAKALQGYEFPDVRLRRPDVPEKLAALIAAMTSPEASGRPATAAYLVELLEDGELLKRPAPVPEPASASRDASRSPAAGARTGHEESLTQALLAVGVALAALAAVLVVLLVRKGIL